MKTFPLFIALLFFTCLSFAQERNFKLVKAPTENPTNQKRKAVVIGMSDYGADKRLNNTLNDANDMAGVLTRLGFEVTLLKNNDYRSLKTNLTNWYSGIEGNDMAIFYFAGHGMEVKGQNYLIPVGAELSSEADVEDYTLKVNNVLGNMDEKRVGMKLLILDACRDNPFTRGWSRGSNENGLASMTAPKGTYIAFAASPGSTAQDGGTYNLKNGVFTHFLKQEIVKEGASIDDILNKVADDVSILTNDKQSPYKTGILRGNFYFIPQGNNPPAEPDKPSPVPPPVLSAYYYYVDQNSNESEHFDTREIARKAMTSKNLYGKIYNNRGEVFVVDNPTPTPYNPPPSEPVKNRFADYTETSNNLNIKMVAVQGGTFTMGNTWGDGYSDEKPAHQVTLSNVYIGKYEVTQKQWRDVMGSNPSHFVGCDNCPVEKVSWDDVQQFINKLNEKTGENYRLPTEAEWEYAARGGQQSAGYKYSGSNMPEEVGWYDDNSGSKTHAVGSKQANELGIYDMSGNVYEWCRDWYGAYSSASQSNPTGASTGSYRVLRGGSWCNLARLVRSSYRIYFAPDSRNYYLGFRLARSSK